MRQARFYNVSRMGALFIILSLGLAACAPLQAPAPQATATTSIAAPIPVTGATATPAPTFTPAVVEDTQAPTQAATAAPAATQPAATQPASAVAAGPLVLRTAKYNKYGTVLVDGPGLTLYTLKDDRPGVSTCTGACAAAWPPALVDSSGPTAGKGVKASLLGTLTRPDGTYQATYKGHPLYYFSGDQRPGSFKGQGIDKEWFMVVLAKPVKDSSSSSGGGSNDNSGGSGGSSGGSGGSGGGGGGGGGGMGGGY